MNSDIHDWYKNKQDTSSFFDDSIKDIGYKEAVESIEKNNYKMHKKLIKRKKYRKYGLDCKKINDNLKNHISNLDNELRIYYDISYNMDNFQKVNKKLFEFINLIYDDGKNMGVRERYREKWFIPLKNKTEIKNEKIVYDKSKIFKLKNKIKKGIDELTFLSKNLDLLEKSDKKLKIYLKKKKEIQLRYKKCLNELNSNIENLIEIESIIKEDNLIQDWMKIENYDITRLNNNKKSDFKKY